MNKPTLLLLISFAVLTPGRALAHCDTISGPVVSAARAALDSGNVNLALIWVQPGDEPAVRDAFEAASSQRANGGAAQQAADREFFETLVRIHRAGEGASYEGIKPAHADLGPAIPAADHALETGSAAPVLQVLRDAVHAGVQTRLQRVVDMKDYDPNDLEAGRTYVKAYVEYTHYVEGLHQAATAHQARHEHGAQQTSADALTAASHDHAARPGDHGAPSHGQQRHLPWLFAGLLGVVVVGQSGWMLMRRNRGSR